MLAVDFGVWGLEIGCVTPFRLGNVTRVTFWGRGRGGEIVKWIWWKWFVMRQVDLRGIEGVCAWGVEGGGDIAKMLCSTAMGRAFNPFFEPFSVAFEA